MIRNKSYIFSGDMQVITEILDGKTFHQCASRIDEFYRLKFGDTCITRKNKRFISYIIFTKLRGGAVCNLSIFPVKNKIIYYTW